jgi:hypothetical protein
MKRALQLPLPSPRTWGGPRAGAGRKLTPGRRPSVPHRPRPGHQAAHPVHVTLRTGPAVRCLRSERAYPAVNRALAASSHGDFRILQFSVQDDHLHLIVEGDDTRALQGGLRGLAIRVAGQSCARASRRSLGRSLSRSGAHQLPGGSERARLRTDESPEARRERARSGSLLVGAVVRWVAGARSDYAATAASCPRPHLARRRRLASARAARVRRTAADGAARGQPEPKVASRASRARGEPSVSVAA